MSECYEKATQVILDSLNATPGNVLDCGAGEGHMFDLFANQCAIESSKYYGIEWSQPHAERGQKKGLNIKCADLNCGIPFEDAKFSCIFALSVLEHLLNGCKFMQECHRTLEPNGKLVIITPNISTYFTAFLILLGKMPSSGPHPDSEALIKREEIFKVSSDLLEPDVESYTPSHRHLVVFSYRVLRDYLELIGYRDVRGYGFGLYPFPNLMQPLLEHIDPYHCHQMLFIARK
jgi:predicted SAM-dependent methyltransferase